ncbi:MAG TPA: hypothetical protein VG713_18115 [Pirellulales bacterium]|nr:hypothetical protein [Pirellulales bacterium]
MAYLVGTDEAGYGPNLGPLVISATVWRIEDGASTHDLYKLLRRAITAKPPPRTVTRSRRVVLADSKTVYSPDRGLALLERGVLTMLAVAGRPVGTWREAWQALAPESLIELDREAWSAGYDAPLPADDRCGEVAKAAERVRAALAEAGVELIDVRSRAIFASRWNSLLDEGTKGAALSNLTFELLCAMLRKFDGSAVSVICDKHGGRNRYQALLQPHVGEWLVEVYGESRRESMYRWGPDGGRTQVCFRPRAEAHLPAALASMASKYLRELAMRAFNAFWCARVPKLRPTAGYPRDARRFKRAIEPVQAELGIEDVHLWRVR